MPSPLLHISPEQPDNLLCRLSPGSPLVHLRPRLLQLVLQLLDEAGLACPRPPRCDRVHATLLLDGREQLSGEVGWIRRCGGERGGSGEGTTTCSGRGARQLGGDGGRCDLARRHSGDDVRPEVKESRQSLFVASKSDNSPRHGRSTDAYRCNLRVASPSKAVLGDLLRLSLLLKVLVVAVLLLLPLRRPSLLDHRLCFRCRSRDRCDQGCRCVVADEWEGVEREHCGAHTPSDVFSSKERPLTLAQLGSSIPDHHRRSIAAAKAAARAREGGRGEVVTVERGEVERRVEEVVVCAERVRIRRWAVSDGRREGEVRLKQECV